MVHVKICGIQTIEAAKIATEAGADMIGFVFAKSNRKVTADLAKTIALTIPSSVKKVGVFVNQTVENMIAIAEQVGLDVIQLHGDEPPETLERLPYPTIKAFQIDQVDQINSYTPDFFLIDSPAEKYRGGSGKTFDWRLITDLKIDPKQLILAGGLTSLNVQDAISTVHPAAVDTSSGVETNGRKDHTKIKQFIAQAKG